MSKQERLVNFIDWLENDYRVEDRVTMNKQVEAVLFSNNYELVTLDVMDQVSYYFEIILAVFNRLREEKRLDLMFRTPETSQGELVIVRDEKYDEYYELMIKEFLLDYLEGVLHNPSDSVEQHVRDINDKVIGG